MYVRRLMKNTSKAHLKTGWNSLRLSGNAKNQLRFSLPRRTQAHTIPKKYSLPGMEYCLQIQIDRYEPVFKKYDIVALNHKSAKHNEIGLFV